jgi:leucyl-tRNA synthetase
VWRLVEERAPLLRAAQGERWVAGDPDEEVRVLRRATHQTIARVTRDLEDSFHFNTALAALMELQNTLGRFQDRVPAALPADPRVLAFAEGVRVLLTLLAPFAPHMAEELWEMLGRHGSIFHEPWPTADPTLVLEESAEVVVQVNGKVRARLQVPRGQGEEALTALALAEPRLQPWIEGRMVRKVVVIPDRLVNIVVAG